VDSVPDVPPPWEAFVPVNIGDGEGIGIGEMELIGESFMRLGFADLIYLIHQTDWLIGCLVDWRMHLFNLDGF